MYRIALLLILAACLLHAPAPSYAASDYSRMKRTVSALVTKEMSINGVKGLSIAVVDGGRAVWLQGFGFADEAARVPVDANTVFRAGSISKTVTSMRVMQLAEAGLVDIDADIRRYVPGFSIRNRFPDTPPITPRMLMSHRSGLPTDVVAGMWSENPMTLGEFIPTLSREAMASPPVTQWRYSNVAYSLLGRMVEEVEGKAFSEAMRQGLLEKIGMASSSYVMTEALAPRYSKGYQNGAEAPRPTLRDQPTGSLFTTAQDMASYLAAIIEGGRGAVSPKSLFEMTKPQFPGLPLDFGFEQGLGFMLSGVTLADGRKLVWHGGTAIPHQAFMAIDPESGLGVAILCNTLEASRFISRLATQIMETALEIKTGRRAPPVKRAQSFKAARLAQDQLASYAGFYATYSGMLGTVQVLDGTLTARIGDSVTRLTPAENGVLLLKSDAFFGLIPHVRSDLHLEHLTVEGRDVLVLRGHAMPYPFEKVPMKPIPGAWTARLGKYATLQPGEGICYKTLELVEQAGLLVAVVGVSTGQPGAPTAPAIFPLVPVSDDEAVIAGIGIGTGSVVRAEGTGLYHSGYGFRRVQ
ncbi:MAG: serine hydrolase domain-containing protein [Thermodesulfobacteriota bacterium]